MKKLGLLPVATLDFTVSPQVYKLRTPDRLLLGFVVNGDELVSG